MENYIVKSNGAASLRFRGDLVGDVSNFSSSTASYSYAYWTEFKIYRTASKKYVCQKSTLTQFESVPAFHTATVCETNEEIINFFGQNALAHELYEDANIDYYLDV